MKQSYIITRSGSRNLYFHRQIPTHLQGILARQQVWKSLGTPELRQALPRANKAAVEFDTMLAEAEVALARQQQIAALS